LKSRVEAEAGLRAAQQASQRAEEILQDRAKSLESASTINAEAVAEFVIRQHLLDVDLAGTHARVDAANELLAQSSGVSGKAKPSRIEQIEGLKIVAEIELAGLVARKKKLAGLIAAGRARTTLEDELSKAKKEVAHINSRIHAYERIIAMCAKCMEALAPFELVDDTVLIRPLRWESRESRGDRGR
jgi:hypothetical protein